MCAKIGEFISVHQREDRDKKADMPSDVAELHKRRNESLVKSYQSLNLYLSWYSSSSLDYYLIR